MRVLLLYLRFRGLRLVLVSVWSAIRSHIVDTKHLFHILHISYRSTDRIVRQFAHRNWHVLIMYWWFDGQWTDKTFDLEVCVWLSNEFIRDCSQLLPLIKLGFPIQNGLNIIGMIKNHFKVNIKKYIYIGSYLNVVINLNLTLY